MENHWFDGRKVACYHPVTYGSLVGELIRRVDGRRPGTFFREEVAQKVGADFQVGLSSTSDLARVAGLQFPLPPTELPPTDPLEERVFGSVGPGDWSSRERLSADIPASNGCGNGRSIARICAILALRGEHDGVRYLSQRMVDEAATVQAYTEDRVLGWIKYGLGFGLHSSAYWLTH